MQRQRLIRWGVIWGAWTLMGLAYSSHLYFYHNLRGQPTTWRYQLAEALAAFYTWALVTPLVLALAARFPLSGRRWPLHLIVHLPASFAVSLLQVCLHVLVDQTLIHKAFTSEALVAGFAAVFSRTFHFGLLVYWAILGIVHAIDYYHRQRLAAARLETELARAQLQALRMQLDPHFLFNTLHAVSALMRRDVDAAERMVARLSEFLRLTLEGGPEQEVSLRRELEFLERYLEIEKIRFADRLTVELEVDPSVLDAYVPNLILQPIVENSIRHGISKRRGAGTIAIRAAREDSRLRLAVRDDGAGPPPGWRDSRGVGLANTRARLEGLYGRAHRLELTEPSSGGLEVALEIPFHEEPQQIGGG